jgi:PAS domain S-box-containing protein
MLKKLLRRKQPTVLSRKEENSRMYKQLFEYLVKQISVPKNAQQLIQLGYKVSGKKAGEAFQVYLLFEKYLTSFEQSHFTRQTLRELIRQRFPELLNDPLFAILYLTETEQKNTLSIQFLQSFLQDVNNKFGRTGDGYFDRKTLELQALEQKSREVETFRDLQFVSFDIFRFVSTNYGEALAGRIFEKRYEDFLSKYKDLVIFPHLITLIPKEIVRREHLGIFSQSQIEQVFLEKLAESEQLNIDLHEKVKENEVTQRLLQKNEIMLSSVISSALDAIVILNQDGRIFRWNKAAVEIFGYSEEEVIGKTLGETIFPPSFKHNQNGGFERFLTTPKSHVLNKRLELTGMRKEGTEFPIELTLTAVQHDREYYFNGFIRDISIRRKREAELVATKEKAEQAAKAKSQFLSVMSHEIRTPLNAVIGFTHLLLENAPREDQQEDLHMLQFSGENLLHIINDILDFTKLDSGKVELSAIDFNLRELVQSLYQSFSYRAKEKQIVFDVEYDEKMPFVVKGDSLRLLQVLNNLISNAVKFTTFGSVKLKVDMTKDLGDCFQARFSVIDTGIGIPADKQDKIFEQFIQADSNTTRLFGGTGLGLSISARLVELMESKILIESDLGKGSVFHFTINMQKGHTVEVNTGIQKPDIKNNSIFKNKTVLLAEDNSFNANIARRFIKGWGADMDLALDGQQALEFALRKKYDLILMDVQMPVLDGFSCTKAIRKHLPDLPIIAVTASPKNEIIGQIVACGMSDFVSKPFKPNELFIKMQQYLCKE